MQIFLAPLLHVRHVLSTLNVKLGYPDLANPGVHQTGNSLTTVLLAPAPTVFRQHRGAY